MVVVLSVKKLDTIMDEISDLVALEARSSIYRNFEEVSLLLDLDPRWTAKVAIRVVAVSERQRVDTVMVLVLGIAIVQETSNASALRSTISNANL